MFHHAILYTVFTLVALILFVLAFFNVTARNLIALGLAFLAAAFLFGCAGQAPTPAEVQAYADATHTAVHNGLSDYKEIKEATR